MKLIVVFLATLSFFSFADSCSITEAMAHEYNDRHQHKVTVETALNDSEYIVTINLPNTVEGQSLYSVWLVSDSVEEPSFVAPLDVSQEGEQLVAWYNINAGMVRRHFIVVSFSEGCTPSIVKEVFYG
ncbi:hypothetical protein [Thalassotalea maritima]|uniref:hypothetical protein n=1 Tax=Thalassotalea maritima TaxID=3242416 RepID=UPI003527089E